MTKKLDYHYFVRSGWRGRPEAPSAIGAKFLETLDVLSGVDPIFANWEITDLRKRSSFPLAAARPRIAAIMESNVVRDDFSEPSLVYGYHAIATTGKFKDPRNVNFTADAGGKFDGGTKLAFGDYGVAPDPAIVVYPVIKAALLAINAIWRAPWACAQAFRLHYEKAPLIPGVPLFPSSAFHIPWLAYLSAKLAADLKLPPEIMTEHTPDGGLLMIACEERLDPANPEHVRRARILAETMISCTEASSQ